MTALVSDVYEYSSDYTEDAKLHSPTQPWDKIRSALVNRLAAVHESPMKSELIDLFCRYNLALDQSNLEVSFLMLWSILEQITRTSGLTGYDETIHRASWLFSDTKYARSLLQTLRIRRNRFVHAARATDYKDQYCNALKGFVDLHLRHLLANAHNVSSIAEYGEEVLRLPTQVNELQNRISRLRNAVEFRRAPDEYNI